MVRTHPLIALVALTLVAVLGLCLLAIGHGDPSGADQCQSLLAVVGLAALGLLALSPWPAPAWASRGYLAALEPIAPPPRA